VLQEHCAGAPGERAGEGECAGAASKRAGEASAREQQTSARHLCAEAGGAVDPALMKLDPCGFSPTGV